MPILLHIETNDHMDTAIMIDSPFSRFFTNLSILIKFDQTWNALKVLLCSLKINCSFFRTFKWDTLHTCSSRRLKLEVRKIGRIQPLFTKYLVIPMVRREIVCEVKLWPSAALQPLELQGCIVFYLKDQIKEHSYLHSEDCTLSYTQSVL